MSLNIGDRIPEFELFNHDKTKYSDKDFLGKKTMFVFMPFPFSSVCDKEICELRDYQASFLKEDTNTILIKNFPNSIKNRLCKIFNLVTVIINIKLF